MGPTRYDSLPSHSDQSVRTVLELYETITYSKTSTNPNSVIDTLEVD